MNIKKSSYKVTFILTLRGYSEPLETLVEKLKSTIVSIGGHVSAAKKLGQKDFVRITNRKIPSGNYLQMDLQANSSFPEAIKEKLRLDNTVYRIFVEAAA